jgi:hypothetical protein
VQIYLTGVLENGLPRAPQVPLDVRKALRFPLGSSLTLTVNVVTPDGATVPLPVNSLVWTIKKLATDFSPAVNPVKTGPAAAGTSCDFTLASTDTKQLTPGYYVYDVWHTDAAMPPNRNNVVPLSSLLLEFAATLPP